MAFEDVSSATAVAVTTAEAVAIATPAIPQQVDAPYGFSIEGYVNYSPAATGVALILRVRQTALVGGAQVGTTDTITVANPNSYSVPFNQVFPPGPVAPPAGNQFCLTAQGTTAGGTINNVVIKVRAISPAGTA